MQQPGEQSVQPIGDPCNEEEQRRGLVVSVQDREDEERDDAEPQKSKLVGGSAKVVHTGRRIGIG